jgi:hypothetical protein
LVPDIFDTDTAEPQSTFEKCPLPFLFIMGKREGAFESQHSKNICAD